MSKNTTHSTRQRSITTPAGQMSGPRAQPAEDLLFYVRNYARERPDVAALWCFGIGFVLGWKLKPW